LNLHLLMPDLPPLFCPSVLTAVLLCTSSYSIRTHTRNIYLQKRNQKLNLRRFLYICF
jgi:hypothetical protein